MKAIMEKCIGVGELNFSRNYPIGHIRPLPHFSRKLRILQYAFADLIVWRGNLCRLSKTLDRRDLFRCNGCRLRVTSLDGDSEDQRALLKHYRRAHSTNTQPTKAQLAPARRKYLRPAQNESKSSTAKHLQTFLGSLIADNKLRVQATSGLPVVNVDVEWKPWTLGA